MGYSSKPEIGLNCYLMILHNELCELMNPKLIQGQSYFH